MCVLLQKNNFTNKLYIQQSKTAKLGQNRGGHVTPGHVVVLHSE